MFRRQLLRAGTSVGANYRACCRGKSPKTKKFKMSIVLEEADECEYWLLILESSKLGNAEQRQLLLRESQELTAIFSSAFQKMATE